MKTGYKTRYLDARLKQVLPYFPAVAIEGMRAVGKSTTAQQWAKTTFNLEVPNNLAALRADLSQLETASGPVFIDEWQLYPPVWDAVRRAVDHGAGGGCFLLSGSASLRDGVTTHTGAGRIVSMRMRPMSLEERQITQPTVSLTALMAGEDAISGKTIFRAADYAEAIIRTGFPGIQEMPLDFLSQQLDSYLYRSIDVPLQADNLPSRSIESLRSWLQAYAKFTGTDAGYNEILDAATSGYGDKPKARTAAAYRDRLAGLWFLDPLDAWSFPKNTSLQLKRSPMHHLADPGLAARLMGLGVDDLLLPENGSLFGRLFESLVCMCVRGYTEIMGWQAGYSRTKDGRHEVDLVIQKSASNIIGIEVKLASEIHDSDVRHLRWFKDKLGPACTDTIVVYAGEYAYRRDDGIAVVPLACLGA